VQTEIDPRDLIGHKAVDRSGDKIGTVDEVYLDDATGEPEWAAVRTGIFGRDAFVPLATSQFVSEELRVPYDKSQVKDAPDFGAGQHLSPAQELQLYRYYGLDVPGDAGSRADGRSGTAGSATADGAAAAAPETATETASEATADGAVEPTADAADTTDTAEPTAADTATPADTDAPEREVAAGAAAGAAGAGAGYAAARSAASPADSSGATDSASGAEGRTSAFFRDTPAARPDTTPAATGEGTRADALRGDAGAAETAAETTAEPAGPGSDSPEQIEVVCREERLDITTEWHELGRARLRKYVTTENVERKVPVVRERVRIERVRLNDEERAGISDQEIAEATQEVPVHEERVVVRKHVVPVERIRLITERVTEEEVVHDQLRREQVEVHDAGQSANSSRNGAAPTTPATPDTAAAAAASTYSPGARYSATRPSYGH
jgi:uncharacterized protein (TIGR02271 family)